MHIIQAIAYLMNRIDKHLAAELGKKEQHKEAEKLLAETLQLVGVSPTTQKLPPVATSSSASNHNGLGSAPAPQGAPLQQGSAPVQQGSAPVQQGGAPAPQGGAPVQQGGAPLPQGSEPAPQGSAPVPQGSAPLLHSSALAPQASSSAPEVKKEKKRAGKESEQPAAKEPPSPPIQSSAPQLGQGPALLAPRQEDLELPISPAALLAPSPQAQMEQKMGVLTLEDKFSMPAPIVENKDLRHFDGAASDNSLDGMRLRLVGSKGGLTWGDLMHSTKEDFLAHLNNDLKNEGISKQKLYIFARFKRQLGLLCNRARAVLAEREKVIIANSKAIFNTSVDEGTLKLVELMRDEALDLCKHAREIGKSELGFGFSSTPGPGDTEALLVACHKTLDLFLNFCKEINVQRDVKSAYAAHSMVDVLPSRMRTNTETMNAEQRVCQYLIQNFHDEAIVKGYQFFKLWVPLKLQAYRSDLAQGKRERLKEHLRELCLADDEKDLTTRFTRLLNLPHKMKADLEQYTPIYSFREQRTKKMYQEVHTTLLQAAHVQSAPCAIDHTTCKI